MNTTVAIIGGGPSGLLLSYLLHDLGIDNQVLEHRSSKHVEGRIRAGQLDYASVEFLERVGLGARMKREGLPQKGVNFRFDEKTFHIDLEELTGGCHCTVYGQSELTKDLNEALIGMGNSPVFEALDIQLPDAADEKQIIRFMHGGNPQTLEAKYIIGCDGAHGPCRKAFPTESLGDSKSLPFAWIGLLSETTPISDELTYVYHNRGFALWSMRSKTLSRTYLQCGVNDELTDWSEDRFWSEMTSRLGDAVDGIEPGQMLERVKVPMRGYVAPKIRHGNIILAGDAAHIVPPSAAKGLNLAISDVSALSKALSEQLRGEDKYAIDKYEVAAYRRAWAGQHFSWLMTDLLHAAPKPCEFEHNLKLTQLNGLLNSKNELRQFCRKYVGTDAI